MIAKQESAPRKQYLKGFISYHLIVSRSLIFLSRPYHFLEQISCIHHSHFLVHKLIPSCCNLLLRNHSAKGSQTVCFASKNDTGVLTACSPPQATGNPDSLLHKIRVVDEGRTERRRKGRVPSGRERSRRGRSEMLGDRRG